mmetsp:Transcript_48001/g.89025  ORF Transcript_48001/g.89025 Transcript_48001/m.89025 type:complete len:321 (+) Transcript_48001:229-1191(+)
MQVVRPGDVDLDVDRGAGVLLGSELATHCHRAVDRGEVVPGGGVHVPQAHFVRLDLLPVRGLDVLRHVGTLGQFVAVVLHLIGLVPDVLPLQRRPQDVVLPVLEVLLQVVVVVAHAQRGDAPPSDLAQRVVGEVAHGVEVLVLAVAQSEDGVVQSLQAVRVRSVRSGFVVLVALSLLLLREVLPHGHCIAGQFHPRLASQQPHKRGSIVRRLPLSVRRHQKHRPIPPLAVPPPFVQQVTDQVVLGVLQVDRPDLEPSVGFPFAGEDLGEGFGRAGLGAVVDGQVSPGVALRIQFLVRLLLLLRHGLRALPGGGLPSLSVH